MKRESMQKTSSYIQTSKGLIERLTQNNKLNILMNSSRGGYSLPPEVYQQLLQPHRMGTYMFLYVDEGSSTHYVDMEQITVSNGAFLFVLPHQIHIPPVKKNAAQWYKLSVDEACLSLLPQTFLFLLNPLQNQAIQFNDAEKTRLAATFEALRILLTEKTTDVSLILAHLNTLLAECNHAYFRQVRNNTQQTDTLSLFIDFKLLIEKEYLQQPSIQKIAKTLAVSENKLYAVTKEYAGQSPKEYLTQRLLLEAKRILFYERKTVKEIAFDLGFNDPDYFSRLFKKHTGQSLTAYATAMQNLSGR